MTENYGNYELDDLNIADEWETDNWGYWATPGNETHNSTTNSDEVLRYEEELDMNGVSMNCAELSRRCNSFMNITSSELRLANCEKANLIGARITVSDFHGSTFKNAHLEYSEIENSDFSCCDLSGANLQGATLEKSDFRWADLRGANLMDCKIRQVDFWGASYNYQTILPFDHKHAKEIGMILASPQTTATRRAS